jgi:hypothetical protein
MTRLLALAVATLLALPGARAQEDAPKDDKEKAKAAEAAAKKAIDAYQAELKKAKNDEDITAAIRDNLDTAEPHPLIRHVLANILQTHPRIEVRISAASSLGRYKKDREVAKILFDNAKSQKDEQLQKKCLQRFGAVAPFGMSLQLKWWFTSENLGLAREAIEATESLNSIRMLQPLVELLGELESIREDKPKDDGGGSYGPPPPGVPQGGSSNSNNEKLKRKKELIDATRKAINVLWRKYDNKSRLNTYKDANIAIQRNRKGLDKIRDEEDMEDKGVKPPPKDEKKDEKKESK